jgi:HPt (histidine-containing phosphotransfer) domain-containing protein
VSEIYTGELLDREAIDQLLAILSQDEVNSILETCLEDATQRVANIRDVKLPENLKELQWNAHDLKSSAGQLGATYLSQLAQDIDVYCKQLGEENEPDLDFLNAHRNKIVNMFTDVSDALHNNYLCKASA